MLLNRNLDAMKYRLILIAIFISSVASASQYLKKENPEELSYSILISPDCLVKQQEIQSIVESALLYSRIKPNNSTWYKDAVHLRVTLSCLAKYNHYPIFRTNAVFVDYSPSAKYFHAVLSKEYAFLGMGPKSAVLNSAKLSIVSAMEDFVKTNFMAVGIFSN